MEISGKKPPISKSPAKDKGKDDNILPPSGFPQLPTNYPFRIVKKLPSQIAQEKRSAAAEASESSDDNGLVLISQDKKTGDAAETAVVAIASTDVGAIPDSATYLENLLPATSHKFPETALGEAAKTAPGNALDQSVLIFQEKVSADSADSANAAVASSGNDAYLSVRTIQESATQLKKLLPATSHTFPETALEKDEDHSVRILQEKGTADAADSANAAVASTRCDDHPSVPNISETQTGAERQSVLENSSHATAPAKEITDSTVVCDDHSVQPTQQKETAAHAAVASTCGDAHSFLPNVSDCQTGLASLPSDYSRRFCRSVKQPVVDIGQRKLSIFPTLVWASNKDSEFHQTGTQHLKLRNVAFIKKTDGIALVAERQVKLTPSSPFIPRFIVRVCKQLQSQEMELPPDPNTNWNSYPANPYQSILALYNNEFSGEPDCVLGGHRIPPRTSKQILSTLSHVDSVNIAVTGIVVNADPDGTFVATEECIAALTFFPLTIRRFASPCVPRQDIHLTTVLGPRTTINPSVVAVS